MLSPPALTQKFIRVAYNLNGVKRETTAQTIPEMHTGGGGGIGLYMVENKGIIGLCREVD